MYKILCEHMLSFLLDRRGMPKLLYRYKVIASFYLPISSVETFWCSVSSLNIGMFHHFNFSHSSSGISLWFEFAFLW